MTRSLERQYRLMYRLGVIPWDHAQVPKAIFDLTEGPLSLTPGSALDMGCGTGRQSARLAALGWTVLAVDASPAAITLARRRSAAVSWQVADLRDFAVSQQLRRTSGTVSLILDVGCLHGLDGAGRTAWARCVAIAAAPDAVAVISALAPQRRPGLPRGISAQEIAGLLGPTWSSRPYENGAHVFHRAPPLH